MKNFLEHPSLLDTHESWLCSTRERENRMELNVFFFLRNGISESKQESEGGKKCTSLVGQCDLQLSWNSSLTLEKERKVSPPVAISSRGFLSPEICMRE